MLGIRNQKSAGLGLFPDSSCGLPDPATATLLIFVWQDAHRQTSTYYLTSFNHTKFTRVHNLFATYNSITHLAHTYPCITYMGVMRVSYQGEPGAYSEAAIFELLGRDSVTPVGHESFEKAFLAVETGDCESAMIPIENVRKKKKKRAFRVTAT